MTTVQRVLGVGQWRTVLLACGHTRRVRKHDVARQQLYIGRKIDCADCDRAVGPVERGQRERA